jgi:hypothetical protein
MRVRTWTQGLPQAVQKVKDENGGVIKAIYNPNIGKYDVAVTTGPSYMTKRQQAADAMVQLLQGNPELWTIAGDIFAKNLDWPGAEELAKRLAMAVPAQYKGDVDVSPEVAQARAQIEGMGQQMQQMMGVIENLQSGIEAQKIENDTIKVDIQNYDGAYKYTEESSEKQIMKIFRIPPVFLLSISGSLGANNQLEEAFAFYNAITQNERLILEEIFQKIFSRFHENINPSNDYSIITLKAPKVSSQIAPEYFPYYSANEIRVANGDEELTDVKSDQKLLVDTLGVGGTQALTAILVDPVLSYEQKKGALKVIFGLSEIDAISLLGENKENTNPNIR